jgi:hypothetical protein
VTSAQISATDMVESITGFEEIAIEKHFGLDVYQDGEDKPIKVMRALAFLLRTREGLDAKTAKEQVMAMPMGAVQDLFADELEELDPEDPMTESGKDSEPSE